MDDQDREQTVHEFLRTFLMEGHKLRQEYEEMILEIMPEVMRLFSMKAADYQGSFMNLGTKGVFPDLNRKMMKIKKSIWDGEPLVTEQPDEILMDIIGHCLMMIWGIRHEETDSDKVAKLDTAQLDARAER